MSAIAETVFPATDYDLDATFASGQVFRWRKEGECWVGVTGSRRVWLRLGTGSIMARAAVADNDWRWLAEFLQVEIDLAAVLASFPDDEPMRRAVAACRGLRLLRQDPWECLASFILSSTKQIVQIQQIIELLCERFGEPLAGPARGFPSAGRIAAASEAELRACKMGFRAPYLLATARCVAGGEIDLAGMRRLPIGAARAQLLKLPGVGRKIADCVLLFGYGFPTAFPVDVWVMKALRQFYFLRPHPSPRRLEHFTATHFGPNAGYAQQYLFHYMRTKKP